MLGKNVVEKIREDIREILSVLATKHPFIYSAIAEFDIILTDEIRYPAATDGLRIFVNPEWWLKIERESSDVRTAARKKLALLLHEALHALFEHPNRSKIYVEQGLVDPMAANVAADAIVDRYLRELGFSRGNKEVNERALNYEDAAMLLGLDKEFVKKAALEEILEMLVKRRHQSSCPKCSIPRQGSGQPQQKQTSGGAGIPKPCGSCRGQGNQLDQSNSATSSQAQPCAGGRGRSHEGKTGGIGKATQQQQQQKSHGGGADTKGVKKQRGQKHEQGSGEFIDVEKGDELEKKGAKVWEGRLSQKGLKEKIKKMLREGRALDAAVEKARDLAGSTKAVEMVQKAAGTRGGNKPAGVGAGTLERAIEELARGHLDWRKLLKTSFSSFVREVRRTWTRLNKKIPELRPGAIFLGGPEIVEALVDVSGSISDAELKMFADAIMDGVSELRPQRVEVVFWDYGIRRIRKVSGRPQQVKKVFREGAPGGSGTSILEALQQAEKVAKKHRDAAVIVIASDLFTLERPDDIAERLRKMRARGTKIAVIAPPNCNVDAFKKLKEHADLAVVLPEPNPFKRARV